MQNKVYIAGSGTYLPGEPIPFSEIGMVLGELTEAPEKIQKWIMQTSAVMEQLLSIKYLHYAIDPITRAFTDDNITMSVKAAQKACAMAGIEPSEIDLICYGSAHQDQMPTASVRIQEQLGIEICDEFSVHANCTSAYKALYLAQELLRSGRNKMALVVSSSISSSELRAEYYNQKLVDKESLFLRWFLSDGAGAIVLTTDNNRSCGYELEATYVESIGGKRPSLMFNNRPAYWVNPKDEFDQGLHHLRQNFRNALGTSVFQDADGSVFFKGLNRFVNKREIPLEQVKYFQVNMPTRHIIDSIMEECEKVGISRDKLYTKLDTLGYCGPPMALVCLDTIIREETLATDQRILSFVTEVSKFMQAGYSVRHE